jgi:hypothetical protein
MVAFEIVEFEKGVTRLPKINPDTYKFPVYEFTLYRFDADRP